VSSAASRSGHAHARARARRCALAAAEVGVLGHGLGLSALSPVQPLSASTRGSIRPGFGLSFGLIHPRPAPFTGGHPDRVRAGHGRWRAQVNAGQHCWKACKGQPFRSSNLLSSATLTCWNTDRRRQLAGASTCAGPSYWSQFRASSGYRGWDRRAVAPGHGHRGRA
jgi:hypothetical protein